MGLSGNLDTMALPDLLQWSAGRGSTGMLAVETPRFRAQVHFERGRIVSARRQLPEDGWARGLVRFGVVPEEAVSEALSELEGVECLLPRRLMARGDLDPESLERYLRRRTFRVVFEIADTREGTFEFHDGAELGNPLEARRADVDSLLLEIFEQRESLEEVSRAIPHENVVPVSIGFLDDPQLPAEVREILCQVDDERSVADIAMAAKRDIHEVLQALWQGIQMGRLKIVKPRASGPDPSSQQSLTGVTVLDGKTLAATARGHMETRNWEQVLSYLQAARTLDPSCEAVEEVAAEALTELEKELSGAGVTRGSVLRLVHSPAELASHEVGSRERFVLSWIDGQRTLDELHQSVAGMSACEISWTIVVLLRGGHVAVG